MRQEVITCPCTTFTSNQSPATGYAPATTSANGITLTNYPASVTVTEDYVASPTTHSDKPFADITVTYDDALAPGAAYQFSVSFIRPADFGGYAPVIAYYSHSGTVPAFSTTGTGGMGTGTGTGGSTGTGSTGSGGGGTGTGTGGTGGTGGTPTPPTNPGLIGPTSPTQPGVCVPLVWTGGPGFISGVGDVGAQGSIMVCPVATTAYTFTPAGKQPVTVIVTVTPTPVEDACPCEWVAEARPTGCAWVAESRC